MENINLKRKFKKGMKVKYDNIIYRIDKICDYTIKLKNSKGVNFISRVNYEKIKPIKSKVKRL